MRCLLLAAIPLLPFLLAGCGDTGAGGRATGVVFSADGRVYANSAENHRADTIRHLRDDIGGALGAGWTVAVAIDELPAWKADSLGDGGDWRWKTCTARVSITGTGQPAVPTSQIEGEVRSYLAKRAATVAVTVETKENTEPAPVAAAPAPVSAPATAATPAAGPRTYRVQPGDTLADISTVFYGAPEHWRRIVEANPGLDPARLAPGLDLVIPPKP